MTRSLRLARIDDSASTLGGSFPDSADIRELAHRLYEQRDARQARPAHPQPALDWFLSLVFRPEPEQAEPENHRLRRAA